MRNEHKDATQDEKDSESTNFEAISVAILASDEKDIRKESLEIKRREFRMQKCCY